MQLMGGTLRPGTISWTDLTVEDAENIRDFYHAVVGWTPAPISMGGYSDFVMNADGGEAVAGVCHARGHNADLPSVWLVYITVEDLDHSLEQCQRLGGTVLSPPRSHGGGRYCVIQDPAGAICALYQPPDAA
jgi:predicted enzyme related to lactoylglutathione lyase